MPEDVARRSLQARIAQLLLLSGSLGLASCAASAGLGPRAAAIATEQQKQAELEQPRLPAAHHRELLSETWAPYASCTAKEVGPCASCTVGCAVGHTPQCLPGLSADPEACQVRANCVCTVPPVVLSTEQTLTPAKYRQ